ncbi:MAG: type II secretion system protein [Fimbriimonadales bacterium]
MLNVKKKKGFAFTLVELLIVIVIIAVLAAIALPKFMDSGQRSKEASLHGDLKLIRNAIELFHTDTGAWPAALTDLQVTSPPASGKDNTGASKSINGPDFHGPYLRTVPNDPVAAAAFTYSVTSPTVGVVTSSASGNGLDGTAYSSW